MLCKSVHRFNISSKTLGGSVIIYQRTLGSQRGRGLARVISSCHLAMFSKCRSETWRRCMRHTRYAGSRQRRISQTRGSRGSNQTETRTV